MNRYIKICIVAVLVVWIFCLGLVVGTFMVRRDFNKTYADSLTTPSVLQYAPETTTEPTTTEIVIDIVTNQAQTQPETTTAPSQEGFSLNFDAGLTTQATE